MNRRAFVTGLGAVLAAPLAAEAQQGAKVYTIGLVRTGRPRAADARTEAFRRGLRELGYVEGQSLRLEVRWVDDHDERLSEIMAELVRLPVDVIVTSGTPAAIAAMHVTTTLPIVVAAAGDFVGAGLVRSLSRPGGNVTGTSDLTAELSGKRLELLPTVPFISANVAVGTVRKPAAARCLPP